MDFVLNDNKKNVCFIGLENILQLFLLFKKMEVFGINEMFLIELIQKEGKAFNTEYGKFIYKKQYCFDCVIRGEDYNKDTPTIIISWTNKKIKRNLYNVLYSEQIENFGGEREFKEVAKTLL